MDQDVGTVIESTDDGPIAKSRRRLGVVRQLPVTAYVVLVLLALLVVVAALADVIAPHDPAAQDLRLRYLGPSWGYHLLGTDELGRDVLSRIIHGARTSLLASTLAIGIALGLGVPAGLISGYVRGPAAAVLDRVNDSLMSVPGLILAITIVGVFGPSLVNAMVAVGIVYAPRIYRVVRGRAKEVREETYVEAARCVGASPFAIVVHTIWPNVVPPVIVQATVAMGSIIMAEASLSFLGLGVQPPTPSWGQMLSKAAGAPEGTTYLVVAPGLAIGLAVLTFLLLGDQLGRAIGQGKPMVTSPETGS